MASKRNVGNGDDRLMTLPELSTYLQLGEKTVLKLAVAKKLPGLLIEKQWRFRRGAIDEWLESQRAGDEGFADIPDGMRVPLGDLLPDEAVIGDMGATDALGVVEELAARAYSAGWLTDKPWFVGAVVEREALASTAMEGGVAFLHTRTRDQSKIARPFVIAGRSYGGIDFGAPDGRPTYLFFLLGLKYDKLHLPILGRLARIMRDATTITRLRASTSAAKMRAQLLREDAGALAQTGKAPAAKAAKVPPQFDRTVRLRAIKRVQAERKQRDRKDKRATGEAKKAAASKKAAAAAKKPAVAKKPAAASKKAAAATKKPAAAAKKPAAAAKKPASTKKPAVASKARKRD
jgi:excisionase family DNA binding protein